MLAQIKNAFVTVLIRMLEHDRVRLALAQQLAKSKQQFTYLENKNSPYITVSCQPNKLTETSERNDIIFISGRFRSGSTLVWNMFRTIPEITAYYEPLNERRWFLKQDRGSNVDSTHLGVEDYWREFDGMEELDKFYDEDWTRADLYMDSRSWDPKLKEYISHLIKDASGRPVLQFNRVDFRLPWLRHHFPNAKFLHIFRNPRDQWLSFLSNNSIKKEEVESAYKDYFYLHSWCEDLAAQFPFLSDKNTPHPYQRFYYLWKLSYLYGLKYSDLSISFEDLVTNKEQTTNKIIHCFGLVSSTDVMTSVIASPGLNRWKNWADDDWFNQHESVCEKNLDLFLKNRLDSQCGIR
ncbi:sulfotransferase [Paraglaciecola sp.]|uniref:sulfotransferase n=1 Tax=Paraglaciecola sp. TaxID=1920173 RepID=UPI00273D5CAD|nr:sulfotransferase [Paraglaciecola sp.]MDP5032328.1 sulfotransferase [Paraglaciecola sp.]